MVGNWFNPMIVMISPNLIIVKLAPIMPLQFFFSRGRKNITKQTMGEAFSSDIRTQRTECSIINQAIPGPVWLPALKSVPVDW